MRYFRLFLGMTMIAMVSGGLATSAFALPDISLTLGGAYPLHLAWKSTTVATKVSNPVETLSGVGFLLELSLSELGSLGELNSFIFTNVVNEKDESCEGLRDGYEWHIVYSSLNPLKLGILFLIPETPVKCGVVDVKIKGSALGAVSGIGEELTELTFMEVTLTGNGKGKPTYKTYWNGAGEEKSAQTLINFGTGYKEAALEVGTMVPTALEGKMFVITNR